MSPDFLAATRPVVFLAFANDQDAHLAMLTRERNAIYRTLLDLENSGIIQLCDDPASSIESVFSQVTSFDDRLAIFHYGGHANGAGLQLDQDGGTEFAHGEGLAQLLGAQIGLKLVFLNGCATRGQVAALQAAGVQIVIATAVPIQDAAATEFAEQFYLQLARGTTIKTAFDTARAFIATRYGESQPVSEFRGLNWSAKPDATNDPAMIWGLYVRDGCGATLDWTLPVQPVVPAIAPLTVELAGPLNKVLKDKLTKALLAVGGGAQAAIAAAQTDDDDSGRLVAFAIVNTFPLPIGEQIRALFAQKNADRDRLRQILITYRTAIQLLGYAALAQLWDVRVKTPGLTIGDERRAALNSFLALTDVTAQSFDHYALLVEVLGILHDNGVERFIRQSDQILDALTDYASVAAHSFLQDLQRRITAADIQDAEVAGLCVASCDHLSQLLGDLAFITLYKHTTIRSIGVEYHRGEDPKFIHSAVDLDGVAPAMRTRTYGEWTDSRSVILQLDRSKGDNYLNLSPLVIDENAFEDAPIPKLYFFSHHVDSRYVYRLIGNPADTISLPDPNLPKLDIVPAMFDRFEAAVFA